MSTYLDLLFSGGYFPIERCLLSSLGLADTLRLGATSPSIMEAIRRHPGYEAEFPRYIVGFCVPNALYPVMEHVVYPICNYLTTVLHHTEYGKLIDFVAGDLEIDSDFGNNYLDAVYAGVDDFLGRVGFSECDFLRDLPEESWGVTSADLCVGSSSFSPELLSIFKCLDGGDGALSPLGMASCVGGARIQVNSQELCASRMLGRHDCLRRYGPCQRSYFAAHHTRRFPRRELYMFMHYITKHFHYDLSVGNLGALYLYSFLEDSPFIGFLRSYMLPPQ